MHLLYHSVSTSRTSTSSQLTLCLNFHKCSAIADESMFPLSVALLCFFIRHCKVRSDCSTYVFGQSLHVTLYTTPVGCKRYQVIPRSLRVKALVNTEEGRRIAVRTSFRFPYAQVRECYRTLKKLEQDSQLQRRELTLVIDSEMLKRLDAQARIVSENESKKLRESEKEV